ncbi:hypothetical protein AAG747_07375 [Rapidithrix thailandica]|uniref:YbbR-like domain-containing protein n=1 Tax=Rapidithrix thailandica TaxID=413964 RepID=A0AAW9RS21_9BACT
MRKLPVDQINQVISWLKSNTEGYKDWEWKAIVICLVTACTFWVFNSLNSEHTANIRVKLAIVFERNDIVAIKPPPEEISVNVTGLGWNLLSRGLNREENPVIIQIGSENPLSVNYLTTSSIRAFVSDKLKEFKVNYVMEDSIFFKYDTMTSKVVKLALDTASIHLAPNVERTSPVSLEPDTIILKGASSFIRQAEDTRVLQLSGKLISADFEEEIELGYKAVKYLTASTENVKVAFDVVRYESKEAIVKLDLVNFPESQTAYITPETAIVNYLVKEDDSGNTQDTLKVRLDFKEYNNLDSTICPLVKAPSYFKNVEVKPAQFKVILEN